MRELIAANRRIIVLQALDQDPARESNTRLLQSILGRFGHAMSAVAVDGLVDWLSERGLVTVRDLGGGLRVVGLTQAGVDAAAGRSIVAGVDRPTPLD